MWWSQSGGWDPSPGSKFIDEVAGECDKTEPAKRAAKFKILPAVGIVDLVQKQAYMMAKLIEELRREQQHIW